VVAVSLAFYCYGLVHSQASGDLATNTWLPVAGVILVTVFAWIRWEARSTDVVAEDARRALRSA
jgi:protein-S-isoprenylcysteine O-methyltransferase Ste14